MAVNGIMKYWTYGSNTGKFAKLIKEIDDELLESLFKSAQKNKTGIFKPKSCGLSIREIRDIGTSLGYKDMLNGKIAELSAKYPKELKKLKIDGKEKEFIVYKGSKTEGANKGFWAQVNGTDDLYLVKYGNEAQIRSEQLASDLYQLGGIKSSKQVVVEVPHPILKGQYDKAVASKWMPVNYLPDIEDAAIMREGFGMDCWLANWDAMKRGNTVMSGGDAARIDAGGALCFRARGGRKGSAFGENVGELTSFFESYSLSKPYIKDMTREELLASLKRVADIPESKINSTIDNAAKYVKWKISDYHPISGEFLGFTREIQTSTGIHNPNYLKETLNARKEYISKFRQACLDTPQNQGESMQEYIRRIDGLIEKKQYTLPFDKILLSPECAHVEKGMTLAERLSPSQKKIYDDSYKVYLLSGKNKILRPSAGNILTTDSMLHSTNIRNLDEILEKGVTTGDLRGAVGTGTGCATQTPMCADFWDVQKNYSIKDYFARSKYNRGEANFLPRVGGVSVSRGKGNMVVVVNKKNVAPAIMENSFKITEGKSILYKDGNMAGHPDYITHRAVPFGVPANAIDRIIIDSKSYTVPEINQIKNKVAQKGLNIKLYDLQGNLL